MVVLTIPTGYTRIFSFLEKMTLAIPVITATNSSALVCRIPNMNRWKIS